jgi:hypothetical protein
MRASAKVDHGSAAVDSGGCAVGDLGVDEILLVLVVLCAKLDPRADRQLAVHAPRTS